LSDAGWRLVVGGSLAAVIAVTARQRRSLSASGSYAAIVLGAICSAAGWVWAGILICFFISATMLSLYRRDEKSTRTSDIVAKGGQRDAWQVFANGGVFAAAAALSLFNSSPLWLCAGAGAIAASTADTWATEIGVLSSSTPRSILTAKPVAAGESGGVTWAGTLAGIGGALLIAFITMIAWSRTAGVAALAGGVGGSLVDSLLGATLQARRWCERCNRFTERIVHTCGTTTMIAGGISWLDNDAVNASSSAFGALLGITCFLLSR
jgi:uncharacterized protein (TIGR00297 family)